MNRNSFIYKFMKKVENPPDTTFWRFMNTLFCVFCVCYGAVIYKQLKRKYPNKTIIIVPSSSLGDLMFLKISFKEMLRYCEIDEYILVMIDRFKRNAQALGFENVQHCSVIRLGVLSMYYRIMTDKLDGVIDSYNWTNFELRPIKEGFDFDFPKFDVTDDVVRTYFTNGEQERGKALILSPYAQTSVAFGNLKLLPIEFWEKLAQSLSYKGYSVYTNCAGNELEPVIKNTKQIFCKISEIENVSSFAGNVIAERSGFVDYSCRAKARCVFLYPDKTFYESWSTVVLGMSDTPVELVYNADEVSDKLNEYVEKISSYFPEVKKNAF